MATSGARHSSSGRSLRPIFRLRSCVPAVLFGGEGVLINNIAWLLRRLPVFAVGGNGDYRIRAVHIEDLARLCLAKGAESRRQCDRRRRA